MQYELLLPAFLKIWQLCILAGFPPERIVLCGFSQGTWNIQICLCVSPAFTKSLLYYSLSIIALLSLDNRHLRWGSPLFTSAVQKSCPIPTSLGITVCHVYAKEDTGSMIYVESTKVDMLTLKQPPQATRRHHNSPEPSIALNNTANWSPSSRYFKKPHLTSCF